MIFYFQHRMFSNMQKFRRINRTNGVEGGIFDEFKI